MSKKFDDALEAASDALGKLAKEHEVLKASADVLGMKIMAVEECKGGGRFWGNLKGWSSRKEFRSGWYRQDPSKERLHAVAMKVLDEAIAEANTIHKENGPALENNARIEAAVIRMMEGLGIRATYSHRGKRSSRHRKIEWLKDSAGWVKDLKRACPTSDGYEDAVTSLKQRKTELTAELEEHKAQVAKEKAEAEAELLKQAEVTEAVAYLQGLGLKAPTDYTIETAVAVAKELRQPATDYLAEHWRDVICGDSPRFETVSDTLEGTWRWGTEHEIVVRERETGKRFCATYRSQPEYGIDDCNDCILWSEVKGGGR